MNVFIPKNINNLWHLVLQQMFKNAHIRHLFFISIIIINEIPLKSWFRITKIIKNIATCIINKGNASVELCIVIITLLTLDIPHGSFSTQLVIISYNFTTLTRINLIYNNFCY